MTHARELVVVDSVTELGPDVRDAVVVCGSHAGAYPAACASQLAVRAIVLHDAGVGRDGAGIAGLALLDAIGIPAVSVATSSARIGDGHDTLAHGTTSHVNAAAAALGCAAGQHVPEATVLLSRASAFSDDRLDVDETRHLIHEGDAPVWALDSVSDAKTLETSEALLFTGSHANLLGGRPATALRTSARLAVYNDAGMRVGLGLTRLPELDRRGIPAAAVAAASARIGDGRSTYHDGIVSAVNEAARALGARHGIAPTA